MKITPCLSSVSLLIIICGIYQIYLSVWIDQCFSQARERIIPALLVDKSMYFDCLKFMTPLDLASFITTYFSTRLAFLMKPLNDWMR